MSEHVSELQRQQALARFLTDPRARQAVLAEQPDPLPWADRELRDRLSELDQPRTSMYSHLLLVNRMTKVTDALPLVSWALGQRLWELAPEYNTCCPPRRPKKQDEALAFAGFLRTKLGSDLNGPAWLADVLRYEVAVLRIRFFPDGPPAGALPAAPTFSREELHRVRPRLTPATCLLALDHDLEEIGDCFERDETPPRAQQRPMLLLLQATPEGSVHQDEVNPAVAAFLRACSPERTLTEVIEQVAREFQPVPPTETLQEQCLALCAQLVQRGVLTIQAA
ncbi:PqqD family peptide modification chaperone [Kitasatospora sp. NPDC101155]|uniref:PqqD family peptide modification chaperone n=1 Tax=Kitasatospora sp. NPDC101155 TaxID=3364097 RepID=UPI00380B2B7F